MFLDRSKFAASFAADVNEEMAQFMADSQVAWGLEALGGAVSEPAWKSKPTWYLVATEDKMIPPNAAPWQPEQRRRSRKRKEAMRSMSPNHARLPT